MSDVEPNVPAYGEMSWFCCGSSWGPCSSAGGGACGNCNSGSHQCAWPHASDACYSITKPYNCGHNLLLRGCGHVFTVTNQCNGSSVTASVADCGPNTQMFCGEKHCCGSTCGTDRLIDLTPSAFSAIASLSSGLLPAAITS